MSDPLDPIGAAFGALHNQNLLAAKEARIKQLEADVERLKKFNDEALAHIAKEERKSRECLDMAQAEAERLREAGDELWYCLRHPDRISKEDIQEAVEDWREARNDI
jgi:multidrug resistance efflux pump